jgi:predicted nucleotide-binding protein
MAKRLIVIDDDLDMVKMSRILLTKWGLDYEVVSNNQFRKPADDSDEAREEFCQNIVQMVNEQFNAETEAILLDVLFEHVDGGPESADPLGYTLGKKIRKHFPQIPIILFTIRGEQQDIKDASSFFNYDGYIIKSEFKLWGDSTNFESALFKAKRKREAVLEECKDIFEGNKSTAPVKPKIFVGSSVEGIDYAYAIQENFEHKPVEVTVWDQDIFRPSSNTLDDLIRQLYDFEFGIFVFSPDDTMSIRGNEYAAVRDNVIFELGLFIGRLGKERSFFVIPRGHTDLHLPTDLFGVTPVTFDAVRSDNNYRAALGPACNQIRKAILALSSHPTS